ncbi:MAG: hypothetical protein ACKPKO_31710, partial [Candidatus Fonsibacter sp.]
AAQSCSKSEQEAPALAAQSPRVEVARRLAKVARSQQASPLALLHWRLQPGNPNATFASRIDAMHRWIRVDPVTSAVMARRVQATVTRSGKRYCH